ncbi:DUF3558 family protein [Amycolatopsis pithecellobii]|uniref:DUF3558 domain-containing protein n=1 Tax=Amycolatopsis pithecellobii TaxID=664692 RepID=A0A6N7YZ82_9PSEU|nr:DUF3558 family protein [Amycolatopsis pithecellobii]MTD52771.1 DUF3558 domain-containing protein [Amycolatopsis pithecellobii]
MTRTTRGLIAALALGTALILAGCSQTTAGTPTGTTASETSSSSGSAMPALDPEPYRDKPCELLSADLPRSLGYTAPGTADISSRVSTLFTGQGCAWISGAKTIQIQILLKNQDPNLPGITKTFLQRDRGVLAYADPTEASGYQAAFADLTDERARGNCAVIVALSSDESAVTRASGYNNAQDSCDTAKQLAEAMIKTLQGS